MTLNLVDLARCIEQAAGFKPYGIIEDFCGEYYSPYYGFFILAMALPQSNRQRVAVELGCDQGRGLISLAYGGGKGATVYGIDHTRKPQIERALKLFNNIVFLQTNSNPPPGEIPDDIYLLHIDTEHSASQARTEFEAYKHKLASPAIVVFDDLHAQAGSPESVLEYFMSLPYPKVQDDRMHPTCGWGMILYE
jgi:hypothetical protein